MVKHISTPLRDETIVSLRAGERVLLSGDVFTARDAAHKRITALLDKGELPPFEFDGQVVYYAGPCPAPPGRVIGSVGPTTARRMDSYAPQLIESGLKVMVGKGERSSAVIEAICKFGGVYLSAVGGTGALISQCVEKSELVTFDDLDTEAVYRLQVRDLPLVVAIDSQGGCIYERR
ncbi:MAG: FumA C-terminus/TtdB family hydratase beta subunit [Oscillospiraceae bacterium]|nr:FumA C-terminus/TtdB family hydratase beta subunit [Oscillospiraceae bacterium]